MRTESVKRPFVALGVAVAAVLAAYAVEDTFEGDALGSKPTGWDGYCAVSNTSDYAGFYDKTTPGTPVADTGANHTQVLSVAGTAARTYSGATGDRVVDLLVMAEELPDEELPAGGAEDQIKFAFDTNGCINLYHKYGETVQWSKLSDTVYSGGTWVRVSFAFDYTSHRCQLKVDGSPLVSDYGYRFATGSETPGSWYSLASNGTALASIDFVGCGALDDLVNAEAGSYVPSTGATTATNGVDFAWFDKNGIAWSDPAATQSPGASGYTLKEAFDTGIDPYSGNKLYVTNAEYTASKIRLTFNGYGKSYKVEKSASPFTDGSASGVDAGGEFVSSNAVDNTTTWEGDLPSADGITYYRVRNTSAATAESVNQFAIKKIVSTNSNTLVALPWASLDVHTNAPAPVTAAKVVMANNLVDNDYLLYYDASAKKYKGWILSSGNWSPVPTVTTVGTLSVEPADTVSLLRGQAVWLVRTTANGRNLNDPFYLYGQYDAASPTTAVPADGALLANPKSGDLLVSATGKISGATAGDEIRIPAGDNSLPKVIKYVDGAWKAEKIVTTTMTGPGGRTITTSQKTWSTEEADLTIPDGQGFMYIPASGSTPTVNW